MPTETGIRPLLAEGNRALFSKRLPEKATYTERQVSLQASRKNGENSYKSLEYNYVASSADTSADVSADHPTQLPNIYDAADAMAPPQKSLRKRILTACGLDPVSGLTLRRDQMLGIRADMAIVKQWPSEVDVSKLPCSIALPKSKPTNAASDQNVSVY